MSNKRSTFCLSLLSTMIILISISCRKIYIDPNRANPEKTLTTEQGLTAAAIQIQRTYTIGGASPLYNSFCINGLITNELFVVNSGNSGEVQLQAGGGNVDFTNSLLINYWANNNKVIADANAIISNAPKWTNKNYASGLIAYASIFKALSIGNLAMSWEKIPDTAGLGITINFISRIEGFKKAIQVLDNAIAVITANPPSNIFNRNTPSIPDPKSSTNYLPYIDLKNTLYALKARYALFAGDLLTAFNAANSVDLTKKSVFTFEAANSNPINSVAVATNNVVQAIDSTFGLSFNEGLAPATNDKRIPFYTSMNPTISPRFRINGFAGTATTSIPLYLPGEMLLIKAEVLVRQGNTVSAIDTLNKIITKKPEMDLYGIGADQPALPNTLSKNQTLVQIYRNRCIELYMSGLKLEDMRRFDRKLTPPNPESKRNFMPYPSNERDNNPNTPPNPAF